MVLKESIIRILNEDNVERYYNYIVNDLVRDTEIDAWYNFRTRRGDGTINYPFFESSDFHINVYDESYSPLMMLPSIFSDYCQHTYGLDRKETRIIWKRYSEIMINKIEDILRRLSR